MIASTIGMLIVLVIAAVGIGMFREKMDATVLKLIYFVLIVAVLVWLYFTVIVKFV